MSTEFATINHLMRHGWQMVDNRFFMLAGRTQRPVDLELAAFIQRQLEKDATRKLQNG